MFDRILELMQQKGIKQKDLAEAVNVSSGNISDWKTGKAKPGIEVLTRIADYFNVSVDYLVGRTDIQNIGELIDLYNVGVMRWINDRAFKDDDKAALKEHFLELLMRYKTAVNKLANSMYSDQRKLLVAANASCEELSLATCDSIRQYLRDIVCWIAAFPFAFNKHAHSLNEDHTELLRSLYEMIGVLPDGKDLDRLLLSEDERDLLDIWNSIGKDGRRIIMGIATEQKLRLEQKRVD